MKRSKPPTPNPTRFPSAYPSVPTIMLPWACARHPIAVAIAHAVAGPPTLALDARSKTFRSKPRSRLPNPYTTPACTASSTPRKVKIGSAPPEPLPRSARGSALAPMHVKNTPAVMCRAGVCVRPEVEMRCGAATRGTLTHDCLAEIGGAGEDPRVPAPALGLRAPSCTPDRPHPRREGSHSRSEHRCSGQRELWQACD